MEVAAKDGSFDDVCLPESDILPCFLDEGGEGSCGINLHRRLSFVEEDSDETFPKSLKILIARDEVRLAA